MCSCYCAHHPFEHTPPHTSALISPLSTRRFRAIRRLEIFVGLASFTSCLVAVDKLYLFYATIFYKLLALFRYEDWEPTERYPRRWRKNIKLPTVCVQLPMFNETYVARRVIDYACKMNYPREKLYIQILDDSTDPETRDVVDGVRAIAWSSAT